MKKLKDYLKPDTDIFIEERMYVEVDEGATDILYGYCKYIGGILLSVDGDNYSLNDIVVDAYYDVRESSIDIAKIEGCSCYLTVFLDNK